MTESYSPNLFLFQSYVGEVLKQGKKIIKTAPFEGIDPQALINNHKNQYIDAFHQYFLAAMGHSKTRELACSNYQKLIRQGLVDKQHLPPSLISSVLAACAGAGVLGGGSTSGSSSLGSASLSAAPQGHSLYIGNMIKTMLLGTCQPSSELVQGLNYLLEGTHKKNAILYNSMLQQIYNSLLVKYRSSPVKRFVSSYLQMCLDEIEAHYEEYGYVFASRKMDNESGKFQMAIYKEGGGYGKFGRCFGCRKQASHYVKEEWLPICGLACRSNVKSLLFECQGNQYFNLMNWLLDCLPSGEQAILTFLYRELQSDASRNKISFAQLQTILKTLIHLLAPNHIISRPLLGILSLIMTKWPSLLKYEQISTVREELLQNYFKVYLLQILSIVQEVPISKQHLDSINFLAEVMKDSNFLINLFIRYDSKFFEPSILARIFNLISQYAKKFENSLEGLYGIVQSLASRFIEKNMRQDDWDGYGQFLKKREIRDIIVTFNKKPMNGFKMLKKLLGQPLQRKIGLDEPQKQRDPNSIIGVSKQSLQMAIEEQIKEKDQSIQQKDEPIDEHSLQQEKAQQQQKQEEQQNLQVEEIEKEQQPLDSDVIINKRIDAMADQNEEQSQKNKEPSRQRQTASNQISQEESVEKRQQIEKKEEDFKTPTKNRPQLIEEERSLQKIESLSDISPSKNYTMGSRQIAIFIRQNLQLNTWSQTDNKLPIPIPSLNKTKVGQFFGTDNPQIRKISLQFLNSFDFENTEIDDVMRVIMNSFSLPKQTQQIERIIGDLSLRLLGKYDLHDETGIYQYIYLLLMVQTTNHNPQVRQNQKLGLEQYLSMAKTLSGGGVPRERAQADFKRILSNSINVKKKYPNQTIFYQKYLPNNIVIQEFAEPLKGSLSRSVLLYLWEYLVIGLVWPGNWLGLFEASLLMGRQGLQEQQKGFFQALKKSMSDECQKQILKLAIDYGNDLIGKPWDTVVKLLYSMQQTHDCSTILDKLFTNSSKISPARLKDFLHALLQFSSSQFQKDTSYTRELFVLRHINNLIEYNIDRFNQLAHLCWPLLKNYFKDICLHPRKQICMSAIDSLKQLSLKLFKLRVQALPHQTLFQTFLYVFERSGLEMKDLIANVMLNLITADIRGGWDQIYSILDVLDTKDKQLVVKLIGRLIKEVGLQRLGNLQRLHSICIKELRVCGDANATDQLLSQLWDLSSFIDEPTTWLQTIRSIKDIFKISLNSQIINILVRLCNKCVSTTDSRRSLDKQILAEVIDLLMFLLEIRGGATKLAALITSLDHISKLSHQFQLKHLIGNCGLLQIFRMFLGSQQKIAFSLFLKKTINQIYLPHLKQAENDLQFEYLSYWCVHQFMNHLPIQLLNLKENDKDFQQTLTGLISSPQVVQKEKQHILIQFPESHKQYYQKSLLQLVFLDIVESIYANLQQRPKQKMQPLREKIEVAVTQSFDCAFRVNRLILLRNFLWNNGFLIGRQLPGLLKQEHRSLLFAVKLFPFKKSYKMLKIYLKNYIQTLQNVRKLKEINFAEPVQPKENKKQSKQNKNNESKREEGKVLIVYAHDASLWIRQSEQGINESMKAIRQEIESESDQILKPAQTDQIIEFITTLLQQKNLPERVCRNSAETLRVLYSLKL